MVVGESPCDSDSLCLITIQSSICVSGVCECQEGYRSMANGKRCQIRILNDPCTKGADCDSIMNHTTCSQGKCQCSLGYYEKLSTTCNEFKLGDFGCDPGDCGVAVSHSECVNKVCVCGLGYVQNDTTCNCIEMRDKTCLIVELGVTNCTDDSLCKRYIGNSFCSNDTDPNHCVCQDGYATNNIKTKCEDRGLNSSCNEDKDCLLVGNSTCSKNICSCADDFEAHVKTSSCIPIGENIRLIYIYIYIYIVYVDSKKYIC